MVYNCCLLIRLYFCHEVMLYFLFFFFFKQKTAYEMRISDWSSDVCSSDLGEKDEAPMLYNGEKIGDGTPPKVDIAVDPIDGTTLTALGRGGAISVIAMSEQGSMFDPGP